MSVTREPGIAPPVRKTNIVFVSLYSEMGGGEYATYNLLKNLDRDRFHPIVLFGGRGTFVDKVQSLGIETLIVPFQPVMLKELVNPMVLRTVLKKSGEISRSLGGRDIDIVHCSDVFSLFLVLKSVLRSRMHVVFNIIFFYEWPRLILFNILAIFFVNEIVTNSHAVARDVVRKTLFLKKRVRTVYCGVDAALFRPRKHEESDVLRRELGVGPGVKLVGMIARFEPTKGHRIFLEAAAALKTHSEIRFVAVGGVLFASVFPFFAECYNDVMRLRALMGLEDRVIVLPHRNDIPDVIRSLDVVVCPSLCEGFGLVVLEALQSGVPVVASRAVGALEVVDGKPGVFVCETGNQVSLAEQIIAALDYRRRQSSVLGVRQFADSLREGIRDLTWERFARNYESIYEKIV